MTQPENARDDEWDAVEDEGVLDASDTGIDSGAATAEEAAMHVTDDPNGPGTGPLR